MEMYAETGKLASALRDKPEVPIPLHDYCEAWSILDRGRNKTDDGPQPISISEIKDYAEMFGFEDMRDKEALVFIVMEMDTVWMEWLRERKADARAKAKARGKRGS